MRTVIATSAILAGTLLGQTPAATRPAFEVAFVKPTPPERQNHLRQDYCPDGGRFAAGGVPVFWILKYAYRLKDYQISGAPAWLNAFDSAYDIEGKPSGPVTDDQCRQMVQSLFADRFKLAVHTEMRESPVYLLTIAKNGPKLPKGGGDGGGVKINGSVQVGAGGVSTWADGWTMPALAGYLSDWVGRLVVDQTGLGGAYGITIDFSRTDNDDRPSIFTAVQEQLGLKLDAGRAPVEMLVIDHIEKPGDN
jgi:uncharacterized protein (TIGR03435 family)